MQLDNIVLLGINVKKFDIDCLIMIIQWKDNNIDHHRFELKYPSKRFKMQIWMIKHHHTT